MTKEYEAIYGYINKDDIPCICISPLMSKEDAEKQLEQFKDDNEHNALLEPDKNKYIYEIVQKASDRNFIVVGEGIVINPI